MKEWIEKGKRLNELIRPLTFPLAIRMAKGEKKFPRKLPDR